MLPTGDGGGSGLFLTPLPEPPGDPSALSRGAATYTAAYGELERGRATLSGAAGQADGATWSGLGATAYVSATGDLTSASALACTALARGASTLRAYASDLAEAKATTGRANAAIAKVNTLARELTGAQAAAESDQLTASDAAQTAATTEAHATANPHLPAAKATADSARTAANQAQSAAQDAWNKVSTLNAQYDAARATAVSLTAEAERQAKQAASKASAGFQAATADLAGVKPGAARGGARGVTGSGSSAWQKLVTDFADWNDKAGWGLNSWGAFGAVLTLRAEASYGGAAAKLSSASAAEDEAFWKWYSREGSYFDWQPKATAYNAAASGATDALNDLRESIVPGRGLMGALGKVGLGAGIGSDIVTEIAPPKSFGPDGLLGGNTDRVMAGANMAASGLALGGSMEIGAATTLLAVPGVDVVVGGVLVGTAVYFGGEFVYQHWSGIEHGVSSAARTVGHDFGSAAGTVGHGLGSAASWVGGELGL